MWLPVRARASRKSKGAASPLGGSVFFRLIRLVNLAARPFSDRIGRPFALTLPEWRVLVVLAAKPGSTGAEVAFESGLDKMAVSRAIGTLERAGRVRRVRSPVDRRSDRVSLSDQGAKVYRAIEGRARKREAMLLSGLDRSEQLALAEAVDRMTDAVMSADKVGANGTRRTARDEGR